MTIQHFVRSTNFGIIMAPKNYDQDTRLARFLDEHYSAFSYYNAGVSDRNYSRPSRVIKPYDRFRVESFVSTLTGRVTHEETYKFLDMQEGNTFIGAQGLSLFWEQKNGQLEAGRFYVSIDQKTRLWKHQNSRVTPALQVTEEGKFAMVTIGEDIPSEAHTFLQFTYLGRMAVSDPDITRTLGSD